MRETEKALRWIVGLGGLAFLASGGSAQVLGPTGISSPPQSQEGQAIAFLSPPWPEEVAQWTVQAIVVPASKPAAVKRTLWVNGKDGGKRPFLSFDVRASEGLEAGRVYHCFAPLDRSARGTSAQRFLMMGWRASGGRLAVQAQRAAERAAGCPPVTIEGGDDVLFAAMMLPTSAPRPVGASDPSANVYRNLIATLRGGAAATVRQVTTGLASLPENDTETKIEGDESAPWVRRRLLSLVAALPQTTPVERFRYGGLLAHWDRRARALPYLKSLPNLLDEIGLDWNKDPLSIRRPGDAQDDANFLGRLNLVEGVGTDALFDALWSTRLRNILLDGRIQEPPSLENQRHLAEYFRHPEPSTRATAFSRFASWYSDWTRLAQSTAKWSDAANGEVIANEAELRDYWEKKLGIVAKP